MSILLCLLLGTRVYWSLGAEPALSMLLGFVLFYYLGRPNVRQKETSLLTWALFATGWLWSSYLLMALAVTLEVYRQTKVENKSSYLLILFACPWLATEFPQLGWSFRLSAAWVTTEFLNPLGIEVYREGTLLHLRNFMLAVEPACSGLNLLQALLIVGISLTLAEARHRNVTVFHLGELLILAWLANTARVLLLALGGYFLGPERVAGDVHIWAGWVLFLLFFAAWRKAARQ